VNPEVGGAGLAVGRGTDTLDVSNVMAQPTDIPASLIKIDSVGGVPLENPQERRRTPKLRYGSSVQMVSVGLCFADA
jgi:hypothetical protein